MHFERGDPPTSQTRTLADGVRFILPRRPLGLMRLLGLVPLLFGLAFSGFAVSWMIGASGAMRGSTGQFQWHGILFMLFGVPFVLVGFAPMGLGLAILFGRAEVDVRRSTLAAIERIGPFRWTRKRPLERLRKLEIVSAIEAGSSPTSKRSSSLGAISAEFEGKRNLLLAPGYPKSLLHELAEHIGRQADSERPAGLLDGDEGVVITESSMEVDDAPSRVHRRRSVSRPTKTDITHQETPDGLTLIVPSAGFFTGSKGLGCFSIVWNGFMVVFTTMSVVVSITQRGVTGNVVPFALFCLGFWGIGIGLFIGALNMGHRRAIIDVVGDTLLISRQNLFGVKQHQWTVEQVEDIHRGPSGMTVNDRPIYEMKFVIRGEDNVGLFASRTDDEIDWMASLLREQLHLDNNEPRSDDQP